MNIRVDPRQTSGIKKHAVVTKAEAAKLLHPACEGEMDKYFPERGATCGEELIKYVLNGPYAFHLGCSKRIVAQKGMISWTTVGMFAFGERHPKHFGAGHTMLLGQPGTGKTLLATTVEEVFKMKPKRIQGSPDLMPSDITGSSVLHIDAEGKRSFKFEPGPIFADYVIVDEISRISTRAQSGLLECMSEGQVTFNGVTYQNSPFVIGTSNEERVGKLLDALDDRFMFQVRVKPFTAADFTEILYRTQNFQRVKLAPVCDQKMVLETRQYIHDNIHMSAQIRDFMGKVAETINGIDGSGLLRHVRAKLGFTDDEEFLKPGSWPVSGRSFPHWEGATRSLAAMRYRPYGTLADAQKVLLPMIRHRMHFVPNALSEPSRKKVSAELRTRFGGTGKTEMAEYLTTEILNAAWQHVTPKE